MPTSNRAPSALRAYRLRELAIAAAIGIAAWNASGCGAGPDVVQSELRSTGGSEPRERTVFVGTYTGEDSRGIHAFRFDEQTGSFTSLGLAAETASPSFLVASADGRFVYAVNETSTWRGQRTGSVSAFAVDRANGRLTLLNEVASGGEHPCHLALDRSGRFLAVANYTSGTFAILPVSSDGQLGAATVYTNRGSGPDAERQQGPHAHQVVFDPTNRLLFAVDLGADRTFVYQFDPATGRLVAQDPPAAAARTAGSGPRHIAFHPSNPFAYVINELSSSIDVFRWNQSTATLEPLNTYPTLPPGFTGSNSTAEIAVHPSGRFLYASNRGHDSIANLAIDDEGLLRTVGHEPTRGETPRFFTIDPSGRWLIVANQDSDTLAVFAVDSGTGRLAPTGPLTPAGSPVSILFLP